MQQQLKSYRLQVARQPWIVATAATIVAGLSVVLSATDASAAIQRFRGRAPINYSSSIPGILKHDVYYFEIDIDGSILDTENYDRPNQIGGITALGEFQGAIAGFRMLAHPNNPGTLDPSDITFRPGRITSIDGTPSTVDGIYLEKLSFTSRCLMPVSRRVPPSALSLLTSTTVRFIIPHQSGNSC